MVAGGRLEGDLRLERTAEVVISLNHIAQFRVTIAGIIDDQRCVIFTAEKADSDLACAHGYITIPEVRAIKIVARTVESCTDGSKWQICYVSDPPGVNTVIVRRLNGLCVATDSDHALAFYRGIESSDLDQVSAAGLHGESNL